MPGKGWVSGYQLSAGAAACTVAVDGAATISTTYACGCMAGNQMQGLTPPDAAKGETCDSACGQVCCIVARACKSVGHLGDVVAFAERQCSDLPYSFVSCGYNG